MGEITSGPVLERIYNRLTRGYVRLSAPPDENLVGGWNRVDEWVMNLFEVEREMRHQMGARAIDRPIGSMKKKRVVRRGAYSDVSAMAYARWMKRDAQPEVLHALLTRYNSGYSGEDFEEFLNEHIPRKPYERLLIVTPSALYSGHSGMLERFRFSDHERTLENLTVASIARSMHRGLSERRFLGTELSDLFDGDEGPEFLVRSRVRARSLVR